MRGQYSGQERRRSPRHERRLLTTMEYEGKTHEIRTINISEHGVLIPRPMPPPIGTHIRLTLTMHGKTSMFEGVVIRYAQWLVNGVDTVCVGIDLPSSEYHEFVKENILIT